MNQEQEFKLCNDFPKLYRGKDESVQNNLMCFGFECGSGWFNLIYELSKKICEIADKEKLDPYPKAFQVKSKYGELRYYIDNGSDKINEVIQIAENKSRNICEGCGAPGNSVQVHGWIYTTCDK
ncbi:MAG: hypothetical protein GF364_18980, partial [Candidatus Lokiarchaeota archaeon]|nr:hypothetical protein [Candidatus Lokiarchaeota archaeon]